MSEPAPKGSYDNPITEDDLPITLEADEMYWLEPPEWALPGYYPDARFPKVEPSPVVNPKLS